MTPIRSVRNYIYEKFCFMVARVLLNNQWQIREFTQSVKASMVLTLLQSNKKMKQIDITAATGLDRRTVNLIKKHGGLLIRFYGVAKLTNILLRLQEKGTNKIQMKGSDSHSLETLVKKHCDQQITPQAAQRELIRRGICEFDKCGTKLIIIPWAFEKYHSHSLSIFATMKYYELNEYTELGQEYVVDLRNDFAQYLGGQDESVH